MTVDRALVMDSQNVSFPVPVTGSRGGARYQRIHLLPYPFFPDVRTDGFDEKQPAFVGLANVTMPWASPLSLVPLEGVEAETLIETSSDSWRNQTGSGVDAGSLIGFGEAFDYSAGWDADSL